MPSTKDGTQRCEIGAAARGAPGRLQSAPRGRKRNVICPARQRRLFGLVSFINSLTSGIWGVVLGHKPPSQPVTTSLAARHQLKCSGSILSMQYFSTKSSGAPDAWLNAHNAQGRNRFSESGSRARGRHRGAAKLLGCPVRVRYSRAAESPGPWGAA